MTERLSCNRCGEPACSVGVLMFDQTQIRLCRECVDVTIEDVKRMAKAADKEERRFQRENAMKFEEISEVLRRHGFQQYDIEAGRQVWKRDGRKVTITRMRDQTWVWDRDPATISTPEAVK